MSLLKVLPNAIDSSQDYTFNNVSVSSVTANGVNLGTNVTTLNQIVNTSVSFKNRFINGNMMVWQRGNTFSNLTSNVTTATYTADRFSNNRGNGTTGKVTFEQSTSVPSGQPFPYSLKVTTTNTSSSMASSEYNSIAYRMEGIDSWDLLYGSANAKTCVLSFWAKSSLTGTFCGSIIQNAVYATTNRSFAFTYTISSANTWTKFSIVVPGDTGGVTAFNNAFAFEFNWYFGLGSNYINGTVNTWNVNTLSNSFTSSAGVNMLATLNATLEVTGFQFEVGNEATNYDYRDYHRELIMCKRYFQCVGDIDGQNGYAVLGTGRVSSATTAAIRFPSTVEMRVRPSASFSSATYVLWEGSTGRSVGAFTIYSRGSDGVEGDLTTSSATTGAFVQLRGNAANPNKPYLKLDSEL